MTISRSRLMLLLALGVTALAILAGRAIATGFILKVAAHGKVVHCRNGTCRTVHEAIVVDFASYPVYQLGRETAEHLICKNTIRCPWTVWTPVSNLPPGTLAAAPGIHGMLGRVRRSLGRHSFDQLTLRGHPLYTFVADHGGAAYGDGLPSAFHSAWHIVRP